MLDLDIKEIEKKLDEERPKFKGKENRVMAESIQRLCQPGLYNTVKEWLNGNDKADYEFMGISIQMIAERYFGGGFIGALFEMMWFLDHPERLEEHKDDIIEYLDNLYAIE